MPFVRLFPCDIVKRQSGGATFYKREAEISSWPHHCGRWPSRLAATAAENRASVRRNSQTSFVGATDLPNDREP